MGDQISKLFIPIDTLPGLYDPSSDCLVPGRSLSLFAQLYSYSGLEQQERERGVGGREWVSVCVCVSIVVLLL